MTKLVLACCLLLLLCQQALGQTVVECFDNSTSPATPLATKIDYVPGYVSDLEVIKQKNYALKANGDLVDVTGNNALFKLDDPYCYPSAIVPFLKDNFIVLCSNGVIQINSAGSTLARVSSAATGELFIAPEGVPEGVAVDKKAIFVLKTPLKPSTFRISPKTFSVVVKGLDYGRGLALTDNDQALLVTSRTSKIFKYTIKNCKVTRKAPTLFADLTALSTDGVFSQNDTFNRIDIAIGKNSIIVTRVGRILVLSQNGQKVIRTISFATQDGYVTSLAAFKNGALNVVFMSFLSDVVSSVLQFGASDFSDAHVPQDIICKLQ
ncbi:hypothetical protein HDU80_010972 [Chytriomyces hyalinus]|nr:hypothetical protein HDU80_010972 [Chytriomyces hyalinus]